MFMSMMERYRKQVVRSAFEGPLVFVDVDWLRQQRASQLGEPTVTLLKKSENGDGGSSGVGPATKDGTGVLSQDATDSTGPSEQSSGARDGSAAAPEAMRNQAGDPRTGGPEQAPWGVRAATIVQERPQDAQGSIEGMQMQNGAGRGEAAPRGDPRGAPQAPARAPDVGGLPLRYPCDGDAQAGAGLACQ